MDLTNEDVADILALLDSLPYDSLDLQTASFRLTLRRTPDGWTQDSQVLSEPVVLEVGEPSAGAEAPEPGAAAGTMVQRAGYSRLNGPTSRLGRDAGGIAGDDGADGETAGSGTGARGAGGAGGGGEQGRDLVAVRAPLPGTFYRAPRPGAEPFVEVGSRVSADTVVCIVETMKLMNSVHAGVDGVVAEICLGNAEFVANGATLMRIEAD
jgi:acetyl-CoA carboxylase biotin carboxyl carrier protein